MRLLLDENLPKRLKLDFPEHEIFTVRDKGWTGVKNGQLLKLMLANNFDALLTFDKNLRYQQNFSKYTIIVFVLASHINTYEELTKLSFKINNYLKNSRNIIGPVIIRPLIQVRFTFVESNLRATINNLPFSFTSNKRILAGFLSHLQYRNISHAKINQKFSY